MAAEKGIDGLLQELKQNNNENVKPRYKALRLRGKYKTFREMKDAFPYESDEKIVFGGAIYEYWDNQHFKTTWIERVREKIWFGREGFSEFKWRKFIRLKSTLEPQWPHSVNYHQDWKYWMTKGVPSDVIEAKWSDPTSVLGEAETHYNPVDLTHLDQNIPDFSRREMLKKDGYFVYQDVEVEDIDYQWE